MGRFRSLLDGMTMAAGVLAAIGLIAIGVVVAAQIIGRNAGVLVAGADEIAVYSLSTLSFLGLAYTLKDNGHIRVDTFLALCPQTWRVGLYRAAAALAAAFMGYLTYHAGEQLYFSVLFNERSQGLLGFPIWIPQIAMVFGLGVFALRFVGELAAPPPALETERAQADARRDREDA